MRIRSTVRVGLGVMATAVVGIGVGANALAAKDTSNGADNGIHDKTGSAPSQECTNALGQHEGTFTYEGSLIAWPPNHKYRNATITLLDDDAEPAMDQVTLTVTATHDQIVDGEELKGSGNTPAATDATGGADTGTENDGVASVPVKFRGERSGTRKEGRTYRFDAMGTVDNGTVSCSATFFATVPHDMRDHPLN